MRWTRLIALVALPCALLAVPRSEAAAPTVRLAAGRPAFWNPGAARPSSDGARHYTISVPAGGYRLRVGYDHPDFRVGLDGELVSPTGKAYFLGGWNSGEAYVLHPAAGIWTLRMYLPNPSYVDFRMRALLTAAPPAKPRKPVALLPNLRLVPPFEFTFAGTVSGGNGLAYVPVTAGHSCTADDGAEHQAVRCLRFSLGPANVGAGPLVLDFPGSQGLTPATPGTATQEIVWSDGHRTTRQAGTFAYHYTHQHYHHQGFGVLELLRVDDLRAGRTTPAGVGPKQGFCTGDVMVAEWSVFGAGDQDSAGSTCVATASGGLGVYDPTRGTRMGLSAGWADLYSWEQDGNYVEFGLTNTDCLYLVRSTADASQTILESDETDNTSYALIRVTGSAVQVLERGRGQGPWDRHKVIVNDHLHLLAADQASGPVPSRDH